MFVRATVPATSANLGPGFDCFGLALNLHNTLTVVSGPFQIMLTGRYSEGISLTEDNLVWQTMLRLWREIGFAPPSVTLTLENNIPPARGLGSSSAAIAAGLAAANVWAGTPLTPLELLQLATDIEGHPDNVTPALFGGVTLAVPTTEGILPRILAKTPELKAIAIVPSVPLKTQKARGVLPAQVPRADAVYNIAHASLVVEAFLREDYALLREGMQDRLHQDQRAALITGMVPALEAALRAGAFGAALSGSGPTLLALVKPAAEVGVAEAMLRTFAEQCLEAEAFYLDIDSAGTRVEQG